MKFDVCETYEETGIDLGDGTAMPHKSLRRVSLDSAEIVFCVLPAVQDPSAKEVTHALLALEVSEGKHRPRSLAFKTVIDTGLVTQMQKARLRPVALPCTIISDNPSEIAGMAHIAASRIACITSPDDDARGTDNDLLAQARHAAAFISSPTAHVYFDSSKHYLPVNCSPLRATMAIVQAVAQNNTPG